LGHYVEHTLSRNDSIGGPHALLDRLDLRTAFSEGFSNALSAIVLGDSVYRDASGNRQQMAGSFDIEGPLSPLVPRNPGWFSEQSVHEIVYDIVDARADLNGSDQLSLEFAAVYDAMRDGHATTTALTSIFSFIDALKADNPAEAALIDAIVAARTSTRSSTSTGRTRPTTETPRGTMSCRSMRRFRLAGRPSTYAARTSFAVTRRA
jgi:hypothetical protein